MVHKLRTNRFSKGHSESFSTSHILTQYAEQILTEKTENHDETFDNKMRFMKFTRENSMNFSEPTISISKLRLHSAQHVEHGEVSE